MITRLYCQETQRLVMLIEGMLLMEVGCETLTTVSMVMHGGISPSKEDENDDDNEEELTMII